MKVTAPVVWFFTLIPRGVVILLGGRQALMTPTVTEGELRMLIDVGEEEGTVGSSRGEMLESVFRFGEMEVSDVMSPRNEIVWVEAGTDVKDFLEIYETTQHTRFPVYLDDNDDVVGILSIKDVMQSLAEDTGDLDRPVTNMMRAPVFVPESSKLSDLFTTLQEGGHKVALVVDEYGGIAGLVTLTRILEQIVGRTGEEGRRPEQRFIHLGENTFELDGSMSIDEANDSLDLNIPEGEYNTIAGFVLEQLQQIPVEMQRFWYDDLRFQIIEVDGNKVERVLVRRHPTTQSTIG
jgi:putative hemolysin